VIPNLEDGVRLTSQLPVKRLQLWPRPPPGRGLEAVDARQHVASAALPRHGARQPIRLGSLPPRVLARPRGIPQGLPRR